MRKALYRKYRPATFDDVVGQDHITSVLSWQCKTEKTSHAYLFCGSRGTGKTSCAKILAKAVNCMSPVNGNPCCECESCRAVDAGTSVLVYEMDAASNTGVDYVRGIREEIIFTPATDGVKVYIIDEVHMLSEGAFNALLKTLEEPPAGVMFILATTEMRKVPSTILSRCQRFDFRRISIDKICERLQYISEQEGIRTEKEAAELIAKIAEGGMRDAVSLLELCAGDKDEVTAEAVKDTAGVFGRETAALAVKAIADRDCAKILEIVNEIYSSSKDIAVFISDMLSFYRDMTVQRSLSVSSVFETGLFDLTENEFEEVKRLASKFTYEKLIYHYRLLADSLAEISRSESKRISAEMLLLKMASDKTDLSLEALATRISDLEKALMRMPRGAAVAETTEEIATDALEEASEKKERVLKAEVTEIQSVPEEKKGASETSEQIKITRGLWNLVLDKFTEIEPSVVSYLKEARVFTHNSRLIVEVPINFMKVMLSAVGAEKILSNIIVAEDSRFSGADIRLAAEVPTEASPIDELL